jgi:hypothetical protein
MPLDESYRALVDAIKARDAYCLGRWGTVLPPEPLMDDPEFKRLKAEVIRLNQEALQNRSVSRETADRSSRGR